MAEFLLQESGDHLLTEAGDSLLLNLAGTARRLAVRERPPLRLDYDLQAPSGRHFHWSDSEPRPENVPSDVRFGDSAPGGYDTADVKLARKPGVDYRDAEMLSTLRIKGIGGDVAWEGRAERAPETSGDEFAVAPSFTGWQAHLADDKSARTIFVDRDLGRWQDASRQHRLDLLTAGRDRVETGSSEPDATTGLPALKLTIQGAQTDASFTTVESWYDSTDLIGDIYYDYVVTNGSAAALYLQVGVADDDVGTGFTGTGDLYGSATGAGYFTPGTPQRWGFVSLANTATWTDETERTAQIRRLSVWGDHGLTKRGTAPDDGLWASDIAEYVVGRWAPLLNVTDESIRDSGFVIGQAAFPEPTTAAEILAQVLRFELLDWFVWEDRTFWLYPRGERGRRWRARVAPAQLEGTGVQAERIFTDIVVQYNDVDGTTRTVGPPGTGTDSEDDVLHDDDPENPGNRLGLRRCDLLQMSTATLAEATEVGRRFLEESKLLDTSGRCTFVGHVTDDRGVTHPYWKVRSGDVVDFGDGKGDRRIVKTDKDVNGRTCSADLDSPPEGMAALLERLGAILVPLGLS